MSMSRNLPRGEKRMFECREVSMALNETVNTDVYIEREREREMYSTEVAIADVKEWNGILLPYVYVRHDPVKWSTILL